jgi:hypothetical protein
VLRRWIVVLILRSADAEDVAQIRTCVRASRRMRTRDWVRPHASRRRASHSSVRALAELACAARLLSMRAGEAMARALMLRDASQRAFGWGSNCARAAPRCSSA